MTCYCEERYGDGCFCPDDLAFDAWREQQDRLAEEYRAYMEDADGGRSHG